jgi:tetratricopeptide (TPR) repeat protein
MTIPVGREKQVFLAAIDLPDPAERAAFLDRECSGDVELRRRVEGLLAADQTMDRLALSQAAWPTTEGRPPSVDAGAVLAGRYRLTELLGRGGMGTVWRAEQFEPVRREVAVKLIRPGLDSAGVLARFAAERQALARMDHPNVARVFDAGTAPDGRPFVVMELVAGDPLTAYCDRRRLTPRQRLELFVTVCQAVQHAHQKGVIHRDLKPSNILVTEADGQPKVIDFGIAKATDRPLADVTLDTAVGTVVGTPEYMAPEQAGSDVADIDTRADVYALGVILYELLTGSTPLDRDTLRDANLLEVLRVVREDDPPRPSDKLSTCDTLADRATLCGVDPKALAGLLRTDLDWVVMKALEKDRERRYDSAAGFAADVQRYLNGEPVLAVPPSRVYRVRKFVRRNRLQVIAAGLVATALVLGTAGTAWGLVEARRERDVAEGRRTQAEAATKLADERADGEQKARAEAVLAATAATAAKERETVARADAEKALARTAEVLDAMTSEIAGDSLATQKAITPEQKKFLNGVLGYYQELADGKPADEKGRARAAAAAQRLATIHYRLGQPNECIAALRAAGVAFGKLAADFPENPEHRYDLGSAHNNLGVVLAAVGKTADAEREYRKASSIQTELVASHPTVINYRLDLADSHGNLGNLLMGLGRWPEAEREVRRSHDLQIKLAADAPADAEVRRSVVRGQFNLGFLLERSGRPAEAEREYRAAINRFGHMAADLAAAPDLRVVQASCHNALGALLTATNRPDAERELKQALTLWEKLTSEFPGVPDYRLEFAGACCNYATAVRAADPAGSLQWYGRAIDTLTPVVAREGRDMATRQYLINSHLGRATALEHLRRPADAGRDWDKVMELVPPREQLLYRAVRAKERAHAGAVAEAVAEVAELRKHLIWGGDVLYEFARVYSLAATQVQDERPNYTSRAMEMLRKAVQSGFKDSTRMKWDKTLAPLRDRDDFRKLLADLEKRFPARREQLPPPRPSR